MQLFYENLKQNINKNEQKKKKKLISYINIGFH